MNLTLASLLDVVDRLGWTKESSGFLTYPEYVIFKGTDTIIDETRIRLGLKWNVCAPPFYPKIDKHITTTDIPNNIASHNYGKQPATNNLMKEINKSIERNETSQECQRNTTLPRDDGLWIRVKNKVKKNEYQSTSQLIQHVSNPYQLLDTNDVEDSEEESSIASVETPIVTNATSQSDNHGSDSADCSADNVTLDMLTTIMNEVLSNDRLEVKAINRECSDITTTLLLQNQEKLEHCDHVLGKLLTQLEDINDECHRCIGELWTEATRLDHEVCATDDDYECSNFSNNNIMDGRQKIFNEIDIMSDSSVESYRCREIMSDSSEDSCRYSEMIETDDC